MSPVYILGLHWLGILFGFDKPLLEWGFCSFVLAEIFKIALLAIFIPKLISYENSFLIKFKFLNFINNINGIWKINRKVSAATSAQGYAKISKNKNSEIIINEKFLTIHNQNKISGYNEYLIKITKSKILFFFNTGPNCGKLFQKFELKFFPKSSFYYC